MNEIGILILDDDIDSQRALHHVLDSEGWRVRVVPLGSQALVELASGAWNLVIANVSLTDLHGPVFTTLRELAQASALAASDPGAPRRQIRVLFLVPPLAASETVPTLEAEGLPYSMKPYHLHDFLEKVSDLLVDADAISSPIRSVNQRFAGSDGRRKGRQAARDRRSSNKMFAPRDDYMMTEEEIAEYERQEEEVRKKEKLPKQNGFF